MGATIYPQFQMNVVNGKAYFSKFPFAIDGLPSKRIPKVTIIDDEAVEATLKKEG